MLSLYLYDPVFGQQACPFCWRVFIHSSDVLSRPRPLTVQVEAISAGASLDHAETWPQFSAHLLLLEGETSDVNNMYVTCAGYSNMFIKIPPPCVSVQQEQEAQRSQRAPVSR